MHSLFSSLLPLAFLLTPSLANPIAANAANGEWGPLLNQFSGTPTQTITPPPAPPPTTRTPSPSLADPNPSKDAGGATCRDSDLGCMGAADANIMRTLKNYMSPLNRFPDRRYRAGQKVACKRQNGFPNVGGGYFCVYADGEGFPKEGLEGGLMLRKMQQLIDHGCNGCGSVPFDYGNDEKKMGVLMVKFVQKSDCVGLCFYGKNGFVEQWSMDGDHEGGAIVGNGGRNGGGNGGGNDGGNGGSNGGGAAAVNNAASEGQVANGRHGWQAVNFTMGTQLVVSYNDLVWVQRNRVHEPTSTGVGPSVTGSSGSVTGTSVSATVTSTTALQF